MLSPTADTQAQARESPEPSKKLEVVHLTRAAFWPLLGVFVFFVAPSLKSSVAFVILLSLYANFAGDIGAWQAARAERRSIENPPN